MNHAGPPRGADFPYTHRVAASAYIFRDGRLLLMHRANPPRVYAPVGGHLHVDENPLDGLRREVSEETGLTIKILAVAGAWFGSIDGVRPPILGLDYVAESPAGEIALNWEHTDYLWASRADIETGAVQTVDADGNGYKPRFILAAFDLYSRHHSQKPDGMA
jgi:8-oxo-dGTP diphosphatase